MFPSVQWLCLSKQEWAGKYFARPPVFCLICARGISHALFKKDLWRSSEKGPVIIKLQIESSKAFNQFFFFLDLTLKSSDDGRMTPPVPLIQHVSQFSSSQQPFLSGSCRRLSSERDEPGLICFSRVSNWNKLYNAKLRSFSASAVREIGYCISVKDGAITWKPPLYELSHLPTHDRNGFTGGLGKRSPHCGTICVNYSLHGTCPSLIVSRVWFFS